MVLRYLYGSRCRRQRLSNFLLVTYRRYRADRMLVTYLTECSAKACCPSRVISIVSVTGLTAV